MQDKEEKDRLLNAKAAVEESQDGCSNSAEEIIELQDLRMSPIPSLRNRHKQKFYRETTGETGVCRSD